MALQRRQYLCTQKTLPEFKIPHSDPTPLVGGSAYVPYELIKIEWLRDIAIVDGHELDSTGENGIFAAFITFMSLLTRMVGSTIVFEAELKA